MTLSSDKPPMIRLADWVPGPQQGQWAYDEYTALNDGQEPAGKGSENVSSILFLHFLLQLPYQLRIVLIAQIQFREQVGPSLFRPAQGLLAAPFCDLGVIA